MDDTSSAVELATELTMAWLSNPNTRADADAVPAFLNAMHAAVVGLTAPAAEANEEPTTDHIPAVSVRKSLASKDHIISMIDGKSYKTLRRHLATHGLTPEEYRARYNLKADYPMVAEAYSESRRTMAKKIGLGRKPGTVVAPTKPKAERKPRGGKRSQTVSAD
ncbi:putative transcriptional regulator [Sphingomonas sp. SORGH_AS 950]|uniref:MucR family transcriptional regulator n=1 Tax=Sphingomonas sp. SORGH_AS_0950 TaxID=3041792 RepID=UPI002785E9D1|nr:MucR family transcriptional regulator [Sphingomonas sp. SORGH_AS_0950]MDQ1158909.1 putative transcriptional regulator [Sphingomonas sp. SORGH_AS_0950]